MTERLVVVGGDAAGMSAASQARRRRGPDDLSIVAFERGSTTSYAACGIPYWVGGDVDERSALIARSPEVFQDKQQIDARVRHEVVDIDLAARKVTVRDLGAGRQIVEPFDALLIATGAAPTRPPLDGIDADGVYGVQTLDDGKAILDRLEAGARRAVVVGGGYIGLEMAEAMLQRGLEVSLVEMASQPMRTLDADMGELVAASLADVGVELHLETPVEGFSVDDDGHVTAVETSDESLPADLVVLGLGTQPNSRLAAEAGVEVGTTGGIVIDRRQRTTTEGVWAAGDCCETYHRVSRRPVAIALGTIANKQGRVAGINLGGEYATFPGVLGTAVTKVCGVEIARTGLNTREATAAGFEFVTQVVRSKTRAGYFPGAGRLTMKVVAERGTGRLLGAQIVGQENAGKRIDVFATALWNEMTVGELLNVDLSYAPPFSPVWDPVLVAARKAARAVDEAGGEGN